MRTAIERVTGRPWLVPLLGLSVATVAYATARPVPGGNAGLYLQAAEAIVENGFGLPDRIPGYTRGGVPFVYPPLTLYVAAVLLWAGVGGLTIATVVPALSMLLAVYPAYRLGDELSNARVGLLFSSFLFLTPEFIEIKLLANGVTRGPAALLTLTGAYFAARAYRTEATRDTLLAGVCFGGVVLAHPRWLLVAGMSYLSLWLRSPTPRAFARGAVMAAVGLGVASPWLATVVTTHGVEPFLLASQTRGGVLNPRYLRFVLPVGLSGTVSVSLWSATMLGGLYAVAEGRWYLAVWVGLGALVAGTFSGAFIPLALVGAVFLDEVVLPALDGPSVVPPGDARRVAVALLLLPGLVWSPLWMTNTLPGDDTPVAYNISEGDREALQWVASNTSPDASFVVAHGPIDWFPYLADRTMLLSAFGTEWLGPTYQQRQLDIQVQLLRCSELSCVETTLEQAGYAPDYVYTSSDRIDPETVARSPDWRVAFEDDGVLVIERRGDRQATRPVDGADVSRAG